MGSLTLSIVIPSYNGLDLLRRCVASVKRHAPAGTQVIVVDDASQDCTATWVRTNHPDVELITLTANVGFCLAANAGLAPARGDIIELLNNDTEVSSGWADACLAHFDDPRVGSVAPLAMRMDAPDTIDSCGQEFHICGWAYERGHGRRLGTQERQAQDVFGASASCGFYRRSALERVGFLWPVYGAYLEDTDLAFRLRWAGYRCVFEPAARVAHHGSASYGAESDRVLRLLSRNEEFVFWANLPPGELLRGLVPHLGFVAVRCARKALEGRLGGYLAGKFDALRLWRTIARRHRDVRQLAQERPAELALRRGADVLGHGLRWMAHRQCA
ncbi:MAG: glycosyltransferase family 2 protein [Planctomycetes bacterium]|nr:glycosyltransferase family 2 protein [Planctomycetota bacterium]